MGLTESTLYWCEKTTWHAFWWNGHPQTEI